MGDNADNKGGSDDGVISRDLGVTGTGSERKGHVTVGPRDPPQHHGRLGHMNSGLPSLAAHSSEPDPDRHCLGQDFNHQVLPPTELQPLTHELSGGSSSASSGGKQTEPSNLAGTTTTGGLLFAAAESDQYSSQRGKENTLPSNESSNSTPGPLASPHPSGINIRVQKQASIGTKTSLRVSKTSELKAGSGLVTKRNQGESSREQTKKGSVSSSDPELRLGVDRETLLSALSVCFSGRAATLFDKVESSPAKANTDNSARQVGTENQDRLFWNRLAHIRPRQPAHVTDRSDNTSLPSSESTQLSSSGSNVKTTAESTSVLEQRTGRGSLGGRDENRLDSAEFTPRLMTDRENSPGKGSPLNEPSNQSDLCKQLDGSWSLQTDGGSQFVSQQTSPEPFAQHSSKAATVAIGTHALSVSRQPAFCQESYLCGGAVSVLPPIVERAEGDVNNFPPIIEPGCSDVTPVAMPADWNLQKLDASRGRRVVVEPFFRKKSHNCESNTATENSQETVSNGAVVEATVPKVRKNGSHQLPPFAIRQTSLVRDNPQQAVMASKQSGGTVLNNCRNTESKGTGGSAQNQPPNCEKPATRTLSKMECPDVNVILASPQKTADVSDTMVYDVYMDDDTIRVDITGSKPSATSSDRNTSTSCSVGNSAMSPRPSVSEDDDFPEHDYSFKEWSEQKESRALGRQDSKHGLLKQDSPAGREETPNVDPSKQRTSSDGALYPRTRHYSLEDGLDEKDPERQTMASIAPARSEQCSMSPSRRHSLAVNLESERVRRNSVSILHVRPTRVSSPHSRSISPSDRVAPAPKRRHSSKQKLDKFLKQDSRTSCSRKDIAASLEFLTWTQLLSTYPQADISVSKVEKSEMVVTLPVCHVSKGGNTISVTSVEAIEETLTNFYPSLQVLQGSLSSKYDLHASASRHEPFARHGAQLPGPTSVPESAQRPKLTVNVISGADNDAEAPRSPSLTEDANDEMTHLNVGPKNMTKKRRSSNTLGPVEPEGSSRRVSINTCIRAMREGSGNYDSQLIGCQNVGTYAEEETLKVVLAKSDAISCVINAMKAFLEKEELQRQACASLLKMASASEANCAYISQNGGVTAITNTMRRYEDNVDLTRLALSILGYISTTEDVKAELLGYGCHSDVLAAMSRHSDDRQIVCQCCFILGNLVISVETAQQLMLVGGVHTIISMLKRYHDDRDILENGCRALGSFALYDETCLDVAQAGATATVVEAMKSVHNDESVLESACWALACLTCKAVTCEELVSLQGVEVLVTTLESYPKEELLQEYGVRVLSNLAARESAEGDVCTSRVVRVLTSLHQNFADNVELMECMMLALSLVAAVDAEVQQYVLTSGGLRTVVGVMRGLEENPAIQENGCRTLGNMAVNESLRKATEQQGASQAVIAAMLNIDMCPDIQLYGCMALMNLTADLMDNKMRVKNNGAVPTLLSTLRNFPDSPEVVLSALKTLGNLVDLEEACRQLLDDRGLPTIIQIAKNSRADDNIRAFAALVLSGLTALPDLAVEDLLEVEETLVTLQASLPHDPDLALSMCQGLHNLLKSDVGLDTLGQTAWMEVIENAMITFNTHPDIHLTACRIVGTVAMEYGRHVKNSQCPLCARTVHSVLQSMRQFPAHKELQIVGCGTLSCVSETFDHLRKAIIQEGGLRDVTSAMTSFPNDDRLHSVGLIALSYLLPVDVSEAVQDGALATEVISRSMSQFVENEDIQISACRALERCQTTDMDSVYQLLTCVHNAVRRHSGKSKVIKACRKVFTRFGGDRAEHLTEEIINSPTGSPKALLTKLLEK